ncbi:hypothetical protein EDC94DRAFT_616666 [Helicostylum pulchrum]|nr:hypothetical protein EDC94DRAFT_616666 [Helicostylum pulchrum]
MSNWGHLPNDILEIAFQYLEQKTYTLVYPTKVIRAQPKDVFQCQLTCKNWSSSAQTEIYKRVVLKSSRQLESFIYTLQNSGVGPLVKHIFYLPEAIETETRETPLVHVQNIATFCTFLKTLDMDCSNLQGVWKLIREERLKGNFTRLQVIPSVKDQTEENILDYQDAAFSLQQTLRELVISTENMSLDESKSCNFPNIDTVFFKFGDSVDASFINKNMKEFPSATGIEIDVENRKLSQALVNTEFPIHVFPQVKKLSIREHYHSIGLSSYIMKAFPNLQEMIMVDTAVDSSQLTMSTKEAIQFIEYMLCIPELTVGYVPVENQYDVMLGFHDKNRCIDKLKLHYLNESSISDSPILTLKTFPQVKELIQIEVVYQFGIPPLLPRIGLIERSGKNLIFLELDMDIHFDNTVSEILNWNQDVTFSSILQQCPNLSGISILHTVLNTFGTDIRLENRMVISSHLSFTNSLFHTSFLPDLSFWVAHISELILNNCQFIGEAQRGSIRQIDMPNTAFYAITYEDLVSKEEVYLKLTKTISNTVSWYRIQGELTFTCAEQEYENSLQNQDTLSLFIHCKDIFSIEVILPEHNAIFNPL